VIGQHDAQAVLADAIAAGRVRIRLQVSGRSMHPTLRSSDRVTIQVLPDRLEPGLVVLARRSRGAGPGQDELVCHRLVDQHLSVNGRPEVVLVGDRHGGIDRVPRADVLGVVTAVERHGRTSRLDSPAARRLGRLVAAITRRRLALEQGLGPGALSRLLHLLCRALLASPVSGRPEEAGTDPQPPA
jgi:hypothetical protein